TCGVPRAWKRLPTGVVAHRDDGPRRGAVQVSHGPAKKTPPAVDGGPSFDELKPKLDPIVARYPVRAGAMLPVLWVVQKARAGWLSPRSVKEVAAYLEVPQAHVEGVISFYTMFR